MFFREIKYLNYYNEGEKKCGCGTCKCQIRDETVTLDFYLQRVPVYYPIAAKVRVVFCDTGESVEREMMIEESKRNYRVRFDGSSGQMGSGRMYCFLAFRPEQIVCDERTMEEYVAARRTEDAEKGKRLRPDRDNAKHKERKAGRRPQETGGKLAQSRRWTNRAPGRENDRERDEAMLREGNTEETDGYQGRESEAGRYQDRADEAGRYRDRADETGRYQDRADEAGRYQDRADETGRYQDREEETDRDQDKESEAGRYRFKEEDTDRHQDKESEAGRFRDREEETYRDQTSAEEDETVRHPDSWDAAAGYGDREAAAIEYPKGKAAQAERIVASEALSAARRKAAEKNVQRTRGTQEPDGKPQKPKQPSVITVPDRSGKQEKYYTISPDQLRSFGGELADYEENSFLLHGYYNYRHILVGPIGEAEAQTMRIGVPGNYYKREEIVADMFGFIEFIPSKGETQTGAFGYYYTRHMTVHHFG